MQLLVSSQQATACPDRATLVDFVLGRLPEPELEAVAGHVASCVRCGPLLDDIQQGQDDDCMLADLRRCLRQSTAVDEPGCARMVARVLEAGRTTLGTTVPHLAGGEEGPLPKAMGSYEVLGKIGQGGMGVVYRAVQRPVNRPVALKMVLAGSHAGPAAIGRFHTEGEAIARLHHPNVVQIYEFGEYEGLPYFSMELVEGGNLAARLAGGPLPPREAAGLIQTLAAAVEFAHRRQVLHRDLKPGNILLTADGVPKITDFGLAKLLDADDGQTLTDTIMGTPSYMAPEQAEGRSGAASEATDVHALGAILYETLTGRPPFKGATRAQTLEQVRSVEPVPPSHLRPGLPRDLEAICLKCLEKVPARRYPSAQALADDLGRWLRGEPTAARPRPWPVRLLRAMRRRAAVVLAGLVLLGLVVVLYLADPQRPARDIESELARGRPVTVIGETGMPRWYRWRAGEASTQISLAPDGSFSVHTWSLCLLELVPSVRQESYRITMEVRHEKSDISGEAGFFFAYHAYPGREGDIQLFTQLTYNDVRNVTEMFDLLPEKERKKAAAGNRAYLFPHLYSEGKEGSVIDRRMSGPAGPPFKASNMGNRWRRLEVLVTPAAIQSSWDGNPLKDFALADLLERVDDNWTDLRSLRPDDPFVQGVPAEFPASGGLGLYLFYGSASYRNVTITPVPGADPAPPGGP